MIDGRIRAYCIWLCAFWQDQGKVRLGVHTSFLCCFKTTLKKVGTNTLKINVLFVGDGCGQ